jgi:hypothetical protein
MLFADDLRACRDYLRQPRRPRGAAEMIGDLAAKDALLASIVEVIPRDLLAPLVRAMPIAVPSAKERRRSPWSAPGPAMPVLDTSLTTALIANARNADDAGAALVAIADDEDLKRCWPSAFAALAEVEPRGVLARADRAPQDSVRDAYTNVAQRSARDAFDLMTPWLENRRPGEYQPWDLVANAAPSALREEPRWVHRAIAFGGRPVLHAIARDRGDAQCDRALQYFIDNVNASTDVVGRRWALEALGTTGHPKAMPTLLAAFHDPTIGSAMALTLEAISKCADGDVIPTLEKRLDGPWKKYIEKAVDVIRARKSGLSREQIIVACNDADPVISGLAQQARDGDDAARVVLEDALRERSLSPFENG